MNLTHRIVRNVVCPLGLLLLIGCSGQQTKTAGEADKTTNAAKTQNDGQNASGRQTAQRKTSNGQDAEIPDGTPEELLAKIRQMARQIAHSSPDNENTFRSQLRLILRISEKILAANPKEEIRIEAIQAKIGMLQGLQRFGDKTAAEELATFIKTLKKDKNETIRELAVRQDLQSRAAQIPALDNKQRQQLFEETVAFVRGGDLRNRFGTGLQVAQMIEQHGQKELAARLYTALANILKQSKDRQLSAMARTVEGMARRLTLVGQPLQLEGTTVEGKPFRMEDYKGKVVLVDFWATWCGPCRAAMPALKQRYEQYHAQGFEVVGVSLDSNKSDLEDYIRSNNLPWPNLFHEGPEGQHPAAEYYGIMQIPTTILVDRTGKVVALDAHGAQLDRLITGLLKQQPASGKPTDSSPGNATRGNAKTSDSPKTKTPAVKADKPTAQPADKSPLSTVPPTSATPPQSAGKPKAADIPKAAGKQKTAEKPKTATKPKTRTGSSDPTSPPAEKSDGDRSSRKNTSDAHRDSDKPNRQRPVTAPQPPGK